MLYTDGPSPLLWENPIEAKRITALAVERTALKYKKGLSALKAMTAKKVLSNAASFSCNRVSLAMFWTQRGGAMTLRMTFNPFPVPACNISGLKIHPANSIFSGSVSHLLCSVF